MATNADTNYLDPSSVDLKKNRVRISSVEKDDVFAEESAEYNSGEFSASYQDLEKFRFQKTKRELIMSYLSIAIEGDLAGFQIAWLMMSIVFLILKMLNITQVIKTIEWWAIFVIPILNALLTAWFDFIIRKYRSTETIESLKKPRFVILWAIKVIFVVYVTTYWIWGEGSFMARFKHNDDYQENPKACTGQILSVYISVLAASCMGEVMITTVLINSEQNLSITRTPIGYRFILLIIRPFVWVYNRTMVMFLCFYAIYGLMYSIFVVGIACDYMCDSKYSAETQKVGLQMLLVPFTVPSYLLHIDQMFLSWESTSDAKFLETFVIVFLCQSFYVDCLNSLWQFSRRYLQSKNHLESANTVHGSPKKVEDVKFMADLAKELPPVTPQSTNANNVSLPDTIDMKNELASKSQTYDTVALK